MVRRFAVDGAVMGLTLGVVHAQDDMMGDEPPPPHPEVVLAPPKGFEPPEDMPPRMTGDPDADAGTMLDTFFTVDGRRWQWRRRLRGVQSLGPPRSYASSGDTMEEGMPPGDPPMGDT